MLKAYSAYSGQRGAAGRPADGEAAAQSAGERPEHVVPVDDDERGRRTSEVLRCRHGLGRPPPPEVPEPASAPPAIAPCPAIEALRGEVAVLGPAGGDALGREGAGPLGVMAGEPVQDG
ncbi:hypothetical protein GCM10010129_70050 [Streptomyces fumigatiscleroticus]|nr:hypothetical protein GCM10010129_70050 [Streptomyces fumigatiscleroticus]